MATFKKDEQVILRRNSGRYQRGETAWIIGPVPNHADLYRIAPERGGNLFTEVVSARKLKRAAEPSVRSC